MIFLHLMGRLPLSSLAGVVTFEEYQDASCLLQCLVGLPLTLSLSLSLSAGASGQLPNGPLSALLTWL